VAIAEIAGQRCAAPVLRALGVSSARFYRFKAAARTSPLPEITVRVARVCSVSGRRLGDVERQTVRDLLYGERFIDRTPTEIYACLLDEGMYHCSVRTMYRLLKEDVVNKSRIRVTRHAVYSRPELLATRPNELWSWDITRLKGPRAWTYFYLYVILDVFSRYVVGFMVAHHESMALAKELIDQTLLKQCIVPGQLTLHADRGAAMTSKPVALLLSDLGVAKTHSRPNVSNDNPYSEAQFKTLKYRPEFPERFSTIEQAREVCAALIAWYNGEHYHGGIALLTPEMVHSGRASEVIRVRQSRLDAAFAMHPQRFVNHAPVHPALPTAVWINPPLPSAEASSDATFKT
jgi:putative transposase